MVTIDVVREVGWWSGMNSYKKDSSPNLKMRKKILSRVFPRSENHFRNLSKIGFLFHNLFTPYTRPIMSNEFDYQLLRYNYFLSKHEGGNLERRKFCMYQEFSYQVEENWVLKKVDEPFPTLKFYSRKKVNPIVLHIFKLNKEFTQYFQFLCRNTQWFQEHHMHLQY